MLSTPDYQLVLLVDKEGEIGVELLPVDVVDSSRFRDGGAVEIESVHLPG